MHQQEISDVMNKIVQVIKCTVVCVSYFCESSQYEMEMVVGAGFWGNIFIGASTVVGAAGGFVGGALAGCAVGSAVPVLGTAAGATLGGVSGGISGGLAGAGVGVALATYWGI